MYKAPDAAAVAKPVADSTTAEGIGGGKEA